jgi:hypothetical protein
MSANTSASALKQIGFCNVGTLATTPGDPLLIGFRKGASLEITPHKDIKDHLNKSFRNMINFKAEAESLQPSMRLISKMHAWVNQLADIQIMTNPQSSSADSEDVVKFVGDYLAGIDWELNISHEMRSLKVTSEAAFEYTAAQTFIDTFDSAAPVSLGTGEGGDLSLYRAPSFLACEYPTGTALFAKGDITDRKLTIKTKGKKTTNNQSIVDYLSILLELTARDAGVAKMITEMTKAMSGAILLKELNTGAFYDAFAFAANVLNVRDELRIGDDDRTLKVILEGDVPIWDIDFTFGAAYGGDAGDTTGLKGGTITIG